MWIFINNNHYSSLEQKKIINMEYDSHTNIIKLKEEQFSICDNIHSFDYQMNKFIKSLTEIDLNSNWVIQIGPILKNKRYTLHTFKRKGMLSVYSIGKSIKGCRIMIIEPSKEYVNYINNRFNYKEKVLHIIEQEIDLLKQKLIKMVIDA